MLVDMEGGRRPAGSGGSATPAEPVDDLLRLTKALVALALGSIEDAAPSVTLPQFRALFVLAAMGPCNATELAEHLGTHASTVTRICDRLVELAHVTRAPRPENRRQVVLDVTARGRALVTLVEGRRVEQLQQLVEQMTPDSRVQLAAALPDLLRAVEGQHGAPAGGWAH